MALYGYARVSTLDQNLGIQRAALKAAGCDVIRAEKASGTHRDGRTELQVLLDFLRPGDALVIARARTIVTGTAAYRLDAGYMGERVVFLVPADLPASKAMSEVVGDVLRRLGVNLDYQLLDWGTVTQRLNSKQPLEKGGWSLTANYVPGFVTMSPAAHPPLRGTGLNALIGWPSMPRVEELRNAWIDATDPAEQKRLGREIQLQAFADVPYIPLGLLYQASAYRRGLHGLLRGGVPLFYNVRRI